VPRIFASINSAGSPAPAVLAAGIAIAALTLLGDVKTTWSFSAFTVLIYYSITNLAALRLPPDKRLYPRALAWCGLASCIVLAFFVEKEIWLAGLALIAAGLVWQFVAARLRRAS
jgi:APA family basic amino acid/polyamine antiporter